MLTLLLVKESVVVVGGAEPVAVVETIAEEAVAVSIAANAVAQRADTISVGWGSVSDSIRRLQLGQRGQHHRMPLPARRGGRPWWQRLEQRRQRLGQREQRGQQERRRQPWRQLGQRGRRSQQEQRRRP
ncbi:hypothetical protein MTO96_019703 [Rhipicephalus appendiculatus]